MRAQPRRESGGVPRGLRGPHRSAQGRTRGDGPRRDRPAQSTASRRRRAAAHHRAAAAGCSRRARRLVGAPHDRHQAQHPLAARADRPGLGVRSQQLPVRLQQRRRRRLRGGARGREPGDRQGQHLPSGHHASAGRGGLQSRWAKPDCRQRRVQLIYRTSHADGERLVADPRTGATGYTGSRHAGLKLKAAADAAGKPIYLELSASTRC